MLSPLALFLLQLAATLAMTGIIWFVQIVHYPLFSSVGESGFPSYARLHASRTSRVVAPLMLIEVGAATASLSAALRPLFVPPAAALAGFVLVAVIWLSTFLLQVPMHNRLAHAFNASAARRLVVTNWIRSLCWTLRALLLLWICWNSPLHPE